MQPTNATPNPVMPCEACGNPVEMEIDSVRFSNGIGSTVVVMEHPKQAVCPTCGTALHLVIAGFAGIQMKTARVPPSKRQLVVPAGPIRVG